ncbi:MAG: MCE family protein [Proteobacteria bacterium]|nr:MCE family protein [Pseudomonadota bacterium]MBU1714697.1 MCE family protein [Pseudomonadota bacterium]
MDGSEKKSTHYIHRTSYRFHEQLVGLFVFTAVGILLIMVFGQIKSQNIFEEYFVIYGQLNSAEGLSTESKILVSGLEVGQVAKIEFTESNDILLTMNINRRYHRLLREDSKIKVRGLSYIIGKSVIELTAGSPTLKKIPEGAILEIEDPISIEQVTAEATKTIKTINNVINKFAELMNVLDPNKVKTSLDSIQEMTLNLKEISQGMKSTDGPFGALVYDQKTTENFKDGFDKLRVSIENIKTITDGFKQTAEELDLAVSKLNSNLDRVPLMLDNVSEVVSEAGVTIKATQRVWPISSSIKEKKAPQIMIDPVPASE